MLFVIIISCNPFNYELDNSLGRDGTLITEQENVEGLFQNFLYSYTFKDTTIYGKLLEKQYSFVYRDYERGVDVSWGRDEEMKVTDGLFRNSQRLDLIWNNIVSMTSDSTNIIRSFNLTITFNPTDIVFIEGRVNLDLVKVGEKWQILRWIDESNF
ncbi:MAG: hypothetical protein JW995_07445 [Melioribacteraceae bacterium]|nr:hypothetical protein [Melioribacteraceae bacterium]